LEHLRPGSSFVCPDRDFPFFLSKRSHGLTDLAPRKALKTASASAAGAAPGLAVQLTFSQGAPQRGAQAAPVTVERVPEAGSSIEVAVALGEAAGVVVASGLPDMPPALAPAAAEAAAVPVGERPVAADAEMAEASALGALEEGAWKRDPSRRAAALSLRGAAPRGSASCSGSEPVRLRIPSSFLTMSGRSSLGTSSANVPKQRWGRSGHPWRLLQGRPQDPPGNDFMHTFFVTKASFVMPRFLPSGSDGSERRQVVVHPPRGRYLGFAAIPEDLARRGYCAPLLAGR
jgi:hypothetical protein